MTEHHIAVSRTARFFTLGTISPDLREVWFVCHGYGQLAGYFLRHFSVIAHPARLIVAPEALSRFYLDGMSGRVGASWMTREDREREIADYLGYLNRLYDQIFQQVERSGVRCTVLGFSQGTATVCRWLTGAHIRAERLILWAGLTPPDLNFQRLKTAFPTLEWLFVIGERDEYARPEHVRQQRSALEAQNIPYHFLTFPGGHHLAGDLLKNIAANQY